MPYPIGLLIMSAVAVFGFFEVVLGQWRPASLRNGGRIVRLGLLEFATRPLPLFLGGIGMAMLPGQVVAGTGLLLLAASLALLGTRALAPGVQGGAPDSCGR